MTRMERTRGNAASTASATLPAAASINRKRCAKRFTRAINHFVIGHCIHDLVGARSIIEIDLKIEIDGEALSDFGLVRHHAVIGV